MLSFLVVADLTGQGECYLDESESESAIFLSGCRSDRGGGVDIDIKVEVKVLSFLVVAGLNLILRLRK